MEPATIFRAPHFGVHISVPFIRDRPSDRPNQICANMADLPLAAVSVVPNYRLHYTLDLLHGGLIIYVTPHRLRESVGRRFPAICKGGVSRRAPGRDRGFGTDRAA